MHSVCINKAFCFFSPTVKGADPKVPFTPLRMNPAEVRLEIQVFAGGLALSAFLLLTMQIFG